MDHAEPEGSAHEAVAQPAVGSANMNPLAALCWADALFSQRYEGWEELGRGAHATIVRTRLRVMDLVVALKVAVHLTQDESRQFVAEAHALTGVVHPCVVRLHTAFERGPISWIEMELVDGTTLADELRRRRAGGGVGSLAEALEIGACMAEGLAAVHAAGFVHRDIKPENVMLPRDRKPAAKLTDFGVVRAVDATIRPSEDWAGSPRYMAPEALVPGVPIGPEADVYALSVALYELFSGGRSPFGVHEHTHLAEVVFSHRRRAPIPLRVLGLGLPDEVVDVIHHGLDKKLHRRPSAADIGRVLRAVQRGDRPAPTRRRHWRTLLLLGLAAVTGTLLGLGGGVLFAWLLLRP